MNCKSKTLLFLSALMVATAPMAMNGAETKEQKEARLKAERAEREIRQANQKKFNKLAQEFYKSFQHDASAAQRVMDKIVAMIGEPGIEIQRVYGFHTNMIRTETAAEFRNYLKGFYEKMLTVTSGDLKVQNLQDYADFLKKNKLADETKIASVLAERYNVKDISSRKLVELYAADLDLEKADAAAQKWLAEQKDDNGRISVSKTLAQNIFSKYKVYGSKYAVKYAKIWMEMLKNSPSAMIQAIHWYAPYAREYALISEDEYGKLMASRYSLPGASSGDLNNAFCFDLSREDGTLETEALLKKAFAAAGTPDERFNICQTVSRNRWNTPPFAFLPELLEKKAFSENVLYTDARFQRTLQQLLSSYNRSCTAGRYTEAKKFLSSLAAKTKFRIAPAEVAAKAAEADLKKFEAGDEFKTSKDRNAVNRKHNEKRQKVNDAKRMLQVVRQAAAAVYEAVHELHRTAAARYYADPSPAELKLAIAAKEQIISILPEDDVRGIAGQQRQIIMLALDAKDYKQVKKLARSVLDNQDPRLISDNTAKIWAQYALGFTAYEEEDYETAVEYLLPMTSRNDRQFDARLYDNLVRSYVALGEYKEALKYTDKMIKTGKGYMKNRLEQQVQELKERADAKD